MAGNRPLVLGTRASPLALWQADYIAARFRAFHPQWPVLIKTIQTRGDVDRTSPLVEAGTRGIFVKEIQSALLSGEVDLGVHSLKDLPSEEIPGLILGAVSPREDPRDALVSSRGLSLRQLPVGARIGTGSPRRSAQLLAVRPDLVTENIRGNVDTRVRKALAGEFDGVVLALAGLRRLGLEGRVAELLDLSIMVPAPGQGIIAVEARADDAGVLALAAAMDDTETHAVARAERAFVRALGGGCDTPLGAYAGFDRGRFFVQGVLASPDGARVLRETLDGDPRAPEEVGGELARRLLAVGGAELLAEANGTWQAGMEG